MVASIISETSILVCSVCRIAMEYGPCEGCDRCAFIPDGDPNPCHIIADSMRAKWDGVDLYNGDDDGMDHVFSDTQECDGHGGDDHDGCLYPATAIKWAR